GLARSAYESGVELKTTKLPVSRLSESNSILINRKDIEELTNRRKSSRFTLCQGCSILSENACECRAYSYRGKKYRYIPRAMIREAVRKAINKSNNEYAIKPCL
ncbi:MAG: DUF2703 domain-containing protein, partial [Candidatus Micrarchaeia archaeon]